jgi:uncharacterized membrane protein
LKKDKKDLDRAEKRKVMLEQRRKRTNKILMTSVVVMAILCIGGYFLLFTGGDADIQNIESDQSSIIQTDTEINIPLSEIDGNAKFYTYSSGGVDIKYFAVKGSDGDVHVGFDACDVCYHVKKGYRQNDDVMHCINCGLEFSINSIGTENTAGGCWPSYLPMSINGNEVVIKISDLEAKRYMF